MKPRITRVIENGELHWYVLVGDLGVMFKNSVCEQKWFKTFSCACLIAGCINGRDLPVV